MICIQMYLLQNDFSVEEIYSECNGSHELILLGIIHVEYGILAIFAVIMAYETQRNLPKDGNLHNYHESAVINLTTILAVLASFVCQAALIILQLNKVRDGILLVITLRDCLWMYPIIYLLFVPKVTVLRTFTHQSYLQQYDLLCTIAGYYKPRVHQQ